MNVKLMFTLENMERDQFGSLQRYPDMAGYYSISGHYTRLVIG